MPVVTGSSRVAVVVVNYRTPELTMRCMAALRRERTSLPNLAAVVVDGGSEDGSIETLAKALEHPDYNNWASLLPLTINGGYGWANNQAILTLTSRDKRPEFIHILNPDTQVGEGAVARLVVELRAHPRCAAVGSQLITTGGARAASAFRFPSIGREFVGAAQSEAIARIFGIA